MNVSAEIKVAVTRGKEDTKQDTAHDIFIT